MLAAEIQGQQSYDGRVMGLQNKAKGKQAAVVNGVTASWRAHSSLILASKSVGLGKERGPSTYPYGVRERRYTAGTVSSSLLRTASSVLLLRSPGRLLARCVVVAKKSLHQRNR